MNVKMTIKNGDKVLSQSQLSSDTPHEMVVEEEEDKVANTEEMDVKMKIKQWQVGLAKIYYSSDKPSEQVAKMVDEYLKANNKSGITPEQLENIISDPYTAYKLTLNSIPMGEGAVVEFFECSCGNSFKFDKVYTLIDHYGYIQCPHCIKNYLVDLVYYE